MSDYEHPEHGEIVADEITIRGETQKTYLCTRCNTHAPRDEPEVFDEQDCDQNKRVTEGITNSL